MSSGVEEVVKQEGQEELEEVGAEFRRPKGQKYTFLKIERSDDECRSVWMGSGSPRSRSPLFIMTYMVAFKRIANDSKILTFDSNIFVIYESHIRKNFSMPVGVLMRDGLV